MANKSTQMKWNEMTEKIVINESLIDITVMWHNKCTLCIIIQTIKLHWQPQTEAQHTLATIHTYMDIWLPANQWESAKYTRIC